VQAAFYVRGVQELTGETPEFRWVVVETQPPFALSVIAPGPDVMTIGRKKVEYAIDVWRRCLATGHWPAYPTDVAYAELPAVRGSTVAREGTQGGRVIDRLMIVALVFALVGVGYMVYAVAMLP
jgi:hypothetical protein